MIAPEPRVAQNDELIGDCVLFDTLGKHRVSCSVDPRNARSIALMERTGFRREAHHRESLWLKGEWCDDLIFAMLRREWISRGS